MLLETEVAIGAGVIAILTGIGAFFVFYSTMISRFAKLELKVNTLWDFLMRRSLASGLDNDVLRMNSPVTATAQATTLLEPMSEELGEFYRTEGFKLDPRELFIAVEHKFGERLLKQICIPYNVHQGACVLAAIDVAKKRAA